MPLVVLTAKPELAIHAELLEAARQQGEQLQVVDTLSVAAVVEPPGLWRGEQRLPIETWSAVLPRIGNWRPDSGLAVLETLTAAGVPSLNAPMAIRCGRDHWLTMVALAEAGLPYPPTVAGADPESLAASAAAILGFPCVVKQRRSRQGVGVIGCAGRAELEAVLDSLWRVGDELVVQRFCPPGGVSRRVLVLGGEVLGATEHRAAAGEFRSNGARGGSVAAVELPTAQAELARAATAAVGLGFAGVDLLPDGDRWVVGEVNPSPGWAYFAAATGVSVAARVVAAMVLRGGRR
ncbi:MAG TPA: RimK family alpha-L-glutamate ligase [Thermoanaerobaculaceae bacterium]|nr:RimK family alpha-L-glutamate ligase [Thermoanaerobaculaceae bacterium]